MELIKLDDKPIEYQYKDVTFLIRPIKTSGDRFNINTMGWLKINGNVEFNAWEYYRALIKTFVIGWRGVTENGKEIPYSYDVFITRFPDNPDEDVVLKLAIFIGEKTGMFKAEVAKEIKNG